MFVALSQRARADLILLVVAIIWGFAFVAQRLGMEHLGPFGFNASRFALGAVSLLPLLWIFKSSAEANVKALLLSGSAAGVILFAGASLQQAGLLYTTAGNAGFITGLYIVFVPLFGLFLAQSTSPNTWVGIAIAIFGLYILSFRDLSQINFGDLLELCGAAFWALHVLWIAKIAPRFNNLHLAIIQFSICAALSAATAWLIEPNFTLANIGLSWEAIAYAGLMSVGIAYTLQIVAQRHAPPAHAAIIMSLETVAAAFGGWWLLNETATLYSLIGCGLMLTGMLVSQLDLFRRQSNASAS